MILVRKSVQTFIYNKTLGYSKRMSSNLHSDIYGKNFINNEFCSPKSNSFYTNINPHTGEVSGKIAASGADDTLAAIEAAHKAFTTWGKGEPSLRSKYLNALADKIDSSKEEFAQLICSEMGKSVREGRMEVDLSTNFLRWYADECKKIQGEIMLSGPMSKRKLVVRKPHGVVGLITPWNHPLNMVARSLGAVLSAGCTLVIKPSPESPLTALLAAKITKECDFPAGVVNVVTTTNEKSPEIGDTLCFDPRVRHISFTGSTTVGKILMRNAASTVKRCSMELGGNSPFIVFESADLDHTMGCLKFAKFRNTGQTCTSPNRIMVHSSIYYQFLEKLKDMVSKLKIVPPTNDQCEASCLYNKRGFDKVQNIMNGAIAEGAQLYYQVEKHEFMGPNFFPPTILTGCKQSMKMSCEEIFGPLMCVYKFDTADEAVTNANDTNYGLAAYVHTRNINDIMKVMNDLECGVMAINDQSASYTDIPFGGVKESGVGRELGMYGTNNYMDVQSVVIGATN